MQANAKIINLWFVIILSNMVHTLLSMMPLFFGQTIGSHGASEADMAASLWFVLSVFLIPMALIVLIQCREQAWARYINLGFASLFLLLNLMHPMEIFEAEVIDWPQLILLTFVAAVSILLWCKSWAWVKQK